MINHGIRRSTEPTAAVESPSGLEALSLTAEELGALAQQGFVAAEHRGQHGPFFKLRFRVQGRQRVKYLGKDAAVAEHVQREVLELQREHRLTKKMHRITIEARKILRQTKLDLQPVVAAAGLTFHGYDVRRTRARGGKLAPVGATEQLFSSQ